METWEYRWDVEGVRPPLASYAKYDKSHRYDPFAQNDDKHEYEWLDSIGTEYSVPAVLAKYRETLGFPKRKRSPAHQLVGEGALREYMVENPSEPEDKTMNELGLAEPDQMSEVYDIRWQVIAVEIGEEDDVMRKDGFDQHKWHPNTVNGVAVEDGVVIGAGRIHYQPEDFLGDLMLSNMAVRSDRRKQGIGTALISFVETEAAKRFKDTSGVYLSARSEALSLYERAGYQKLFGRVRAGRSLIMMHKPLS
jgi:GNAT superfamily N-acetyltransferase